MPRPGPIARFYLLTFAISWVLWCPYWLPGMPGGGSKLPHYLGQLGPLAAAIILCYREGRLPALWARLTRVQGPAWVWVLAVFGPFALFLIGAWVATDGTLQGVFTPQTLAAVVPILARNLATVGFGVEGGWRGYAQEHWQNRYGPVGAGFGTALGWMAWQIPLFASPVTGYAGLWPEGVLGWVTNLTVGSFQFSWFYNTTRGSALACALFHAGMDTVFQWDVGLPCISLYILAGITLWGAIHTLHTLLTEVDRPEGDRGREEMTAVIEAKAPV